MQGVGRAVEVLLSYGANFLAKDAKGLIPLHWGAAKVRISARITITVWVRVYVCEVLT